MAEGEKPEVDTTQRFEYSVENPPPLEVLESKVFAVHATPILPKDGILKAGARDISYNNKWEGDELSSFRPTIHFSLGEVVQEHGHFSWDENPYAVIAPLKALKGQLVNLYPNDTYILGNYRLMEDSVLLVPRGTNTNDLPKNVQVVEYNPKVGLRMAVNQLIKDKNGWLIRMQPGRVDTGSVAMIDDVDINDVNFFNAMYEEKPYVSYGTHVTSERGEAFRFGSIEQATNIAMSGYDQFGLSHGMTELQFYRAFIEHNLSRLTTFLNAQNLPQEAMSSFQEKSAKLRGWLNVVDVDLELRERFGRTLSRTDEHISALIKEKRDNIDELRAVANEIVDDLPDAPDGDEPSTAVLEEAMRGFPSDELREFVSKNEHIFTHVDMTRLYTQYSIRRWILEKDEAAHEHGLDTMLQQALQQTDAGDIRAWDEPVFKNLDVHLSTGSNRLNTALDILQQPYMHEYLQRAYGITLAEGEPKTLESVLRAHPETSILFHPPELQLTEDQQVAYEFLRDTRRIGRIRRKPEESLDDFRAASSTAFEMKWAHDRLVNEIETMTQPMNSARSLDDLPAGTMLSLYEVLRRDTPPADLWKRLGLDVEYRRRFPKDSIFWKSDKSLLDIYKMLNADKQRGNAST